MPFIVTGSGRQNDCPVLEKRKRKAGNARCPPSYASRRLFAPLPSCWELHANGPRLPLFLGGQWPSLADGDIIKGLALLSREEDSDSIHAPWQIFPGIRPSPGFPHSHHILAYPYRPSLSAFLADLSQSDSLQCVSDAPPASCNTTLRSRSACTMKTASLELGGSEPWQVTPNSLCLSGQGTGVALTDGCTALSQTGRLRLYYRGHSPCPPGPGEALVRKCWWPAGYTTQSRPGWRW